MLSHLVGNCIWHEFKVKFMVKNFDGSYRPQNVSEDIALWYVIWIPLLYVILG